MLHIRESKENIEDFYNHWDKIHNKGKVHYILQAVLTLIIPCEVVLVIYSWVNHIRFADLKGESIEIFIILLIAGLAMGFCDWNACEETYQKLRESKK